jgi:hypothetical protein
VAAPSWYPSVTEPVNPRTPRAPSSPRRRRPASTFSTSLPNAAGAPPSRGRGVARGAHRDGGSRVVRGSRRGRLSPSASDRRRRAMRPRVSRPGAGAAFYFGAGVCPRTAVFGGKLPVVAGNSGASWAARTRWALAKNPANQHYANAAGAQIAPRRSPVRARLLLARPAPLPAARERFWRRPPGVHERGNGRCSPRQAADPDRGDLQAHLRRTSPGLPPFSP